ncbi:zinc finger protein 700-like [Anopheles marshallii]|uniref:zinc finger protein 700-like n=1 Tax=Anopheles marshallii TaxID=1521116 RepID=UPI00237B369A|nr:zinc finger protein 700-like [Anopheles marshallii]
MELTMEIPTAGPETYCRLCLGKDSLLGVFSSNPDDTHSSTELVKKIYECTNIKLSSTVDAGCAICHRCLQAVQDFYHFRVRSNKVNDLIQVTTVVANGDDSGSDATRYSPTPSKQTAPSGKSVTSSTPTPAVRKHHHCRYCPKSFRTVAALKEHGNRAHLAGKQHHCPNCLAQFQHAPSLARHVRSRSCFAFSKYRCRVCSESFHGREQWADHIQIHAKDFPYQCPDCWSQFKHKATLRRHANTVHLLVKV